MTKASVRPALEKIQTDIEEIKTMMKNGNGEQNPPEQQKEPVDCLCDETKKELEPDGE